MDPLADLVDWIALYGVVGLLSIGLAERFVPALPSHGVLVAIGIAANDDAWSVHTAVASTAIGSFIGALALYLLVRAIGESNSVALLHSSASGLVFPVNALTKPYLRCAPGNKRSPSHRSSSPR